MNCEEDASLWEIGANMGVGYSAVSHAVIRVNKRMKEDETFAMRLQSALFKT